MNPEYAAKLAERQRRYALRRYYEKRDDPEFRAKARATTEAWKQANPERYKALKADWYERNKERLSAEQKRKWAEKTKGIPRRVPFTEEEKRQRRKECQRRSSRKHREKIRVKNRERWKDPEVRRKWYEARDRRFVEDPESLLKHRLRTRMRHALKGVLKAAKTMELVGCSSADLRKHIESQWTEGMNWSTYGLGLGKWQVDHIRPLVSFSLADPEQQRIAFRFDNLQPLWNENHVEKSASEAGWRNGKHRKQPSCPPAVEVAQSTVCATS